MGESANILAFYRTVADRSPLPIVIYNFPQATGYDIPAEVVIELAEHPDIQRFCAHASRTGARNEEGRKPDETTAGCEKACDHGPSSI